MGCLPVCTALLCATYTQQMQVYAGHDMQQVTASSLAKTA